MMAPAGQCLAQRPQLTQASITALGETRDWPGGLTLQGWLDLAGVENQEIALIQVNGRDVPPGQGEQPIQASSRTR